MKSYTKEEFIVRHENGYFDATISTKKQLLISKPVFDGEQDSTSIKVLSVIEKALAIDSWDKLRLILK